MKPYYYGRNSRQPPPSSPYGRGYANGRGAGGGRGYGYSTTPPVPPTSYTKPTFHHAHSISPKNLIELSPPPSQELKQAVCEHSYLGNKGYTIPKTCLSESEMKQLRRETTLTPKSMGPSFGAPGSQKDPPPCPYYRENEKNLYLPRAYGISRYGLPYETRLSFGRDVREALTFASDKPLRDYQNEIIGVYLEHIRKQVQEFEVEVEGAVENIPTAPLETENNSPNQTHLERVEYGGGGILEVPCGRGKTVMALKIISEIGRPALIFVNKGFLADQWLERIATYLPKASVGRIQADKFDIEGRDIVICMIQTIYDRDYTTQAVFRDFGITVIDEVHRIGSGEYSKAMFNITTPYVLGISATVDRKDGMEQALKLFIGDVLYSDKRQDGDCVQIRSVEYSDPKDDKYNEVEHDFRGNVKYATMMSKICEHRPRLDFLFRLLVDLVEEYPEDVSEISGCGISPLKSTATLENYFLKTGEKKGEEKGTIECLVCHRSVCSEDFIQTSCGHSFCDTCLDDLDTPKCPLCKKRFTLLMTPSVSTMATESSTAPSSVACGGAPRLTEYPGQNQIIVLAQYRSVLKELYKRIQSTGLTTVGYYVGGMKQEDLDISKTKQILLATYSMASEGLDVATLSTLVFATPRTDIKQSVGRILRQKHARNPIVVDVVDSHSTFKNQWSKRRAYYKQNGYAIYKITSDQYGTGGMKDVEKTWKQVFSPSSVAKGPKVVGKKGEVLEKGGCGNISGERGGEEIDSDEDDSEAIRKMAFDGVCML